MARRPRRLTARQRLEQVAAEFEPVIQAAFLSAVNNMRTEAEVSRVAEMLERGDIDGALDALHIEPSALGEFEEALRRAYIGGGSATVAGMPALREPDGSRLVMRFDTRSPGAEAYLQDVSGQKITRITDDIRLAARQHMVAGMADGRNPRSVALDIVGRIDRVTGRRVGGILGLTSQQEGYVATARRNLLSGNAEEMAHYLSLTRRDKRFDRTVLKAIRDGATLDQATVQKITGRLADSYLLLRGETIARTEMLTALAASQREAYEQAIRTGAINRQDVRKVWRATRDSRTRDTHRHLDGESVGMDERFGNGLLFPHDPAGSASEVCNCRCYCDWRIDFLANLR